MEVILNLVLDFFDCVTDLESVAVVNSAVSRLVTADIRRRVVVRFFDMLDASPERLRDVVATRGALLRALVIESKLTPGFVRAIREDAWWNELADDLPFGTDLAEMQYRGEDEDEDQAAFNLFLDDVVLALATSPDVRILSDDEIIRIQPAEKTYIIDCGSIACWERTLSQLLSTVVPKLVGLTKLEVRLPVHDYDSHRDAADAAGDLKLHDLGLDSLRLANTYTHCFRGSHALNWRVKDLYLDSIMITDSRGDDGSNVDAIAILPARQFRFIDRVVVDRVVVGFPNNMEQLDDYLDNLAELDADMRTVLVALFPLAASNGNLKITNFDDLRQQLHELRPQLPPRGTHVCDWYGHSRAFSL